MRQCGNVVNVELSMVNVKRQYITERENNYQEYI